LGKRTWTKAETEFIETVVKELGDSEKAYVNEIRAGMVRAGFPARSGRSITTKVRRVRRETQRKAAIGQAIEVALGKDRPLGDQPEHFWPLEDKEERLPPSRLDQTSERGRDGHAAKYQVLKALVEEAQDARAGCAIEPTPGKGLIISDTHGHLMRVDTIRAAVMANLDAEYVAILGDVFDFYDLSFFKSQIRVPLMAEWDIVGRMIQTFSDLYDRTIIVRGNHDIRPVKRIQSILDCVDIYPLMRGALDPLIMLKEGFGFNPEGEIAKRYNWKGTVEYSAIGTAAEGCLLKHGNALFSHVDRFLRGQPGRTAAVVSADASNSWGIGHDCLIQAHTHSQSWGIIGNRLLLMECGCCSDEAEYTRNKALRYRPQSLGWVELYQHDDGTIDLARTRVVHYGDGKQRRLYDEAEESL
jgi:hypothetical protein